MIIHDYSKLSTPSGSTASQCKTVGPGAGSRPELRLILAGLVMETLYSTGASHTRNLKPASYIQQSSDSRPPVLASLHRTKKKERADRPPHAIRQGPWSTWSGDECNEATTRKSRLRFVGFIMARTGDKRPPKRPCWENWREAGGTGEDNECGWLKKLQEAGPRSVRHHHQQEGA